MPSNQKTFTDVNAAEYAEFRKHVRSKGWAPPSSDNGLLRGPGLDADLSYDEKGSTLSMRIRNVGKGDTYDSIFREVETILKGVDR